MEKKQPVQEKESEAEKVDLNLDNMEDSEDFVQQAKQEAQQETEEATGGSQSEDVALNLDEINTDDINGDAEEREAAETSDESDTDQQEPTSAPEENGGEQAQEEADTEDEEEEVTVSKQEWKALKQEKEQNEGRWKRALADYENLQKQSREERERLVTEANQNLMRSLIPLLDNFNMALEHVPEDLEDNNWVEGVTYINRQMLEILQDEGLEMLKPQGEPFDPEVHEAVETSNGEDTEETDEETEGEETDTPTVKKVVQPGYVFHGKVLKPAKVVVE